MSSYSCTYGPLQPKIPHTGVLFPARGRWAFDSIDSVELYRYVSLSSSKRTLSTGRVVVMMREPNFDALGANE